MSAIIIQKQHVSLTLNHTLYSRVVSVCLLKAWLNSRGLLNQAADSLSRRKYEYNNTETDRKIPELLDLNEAESDTETCPMIGCIKSRKRAATVKKYETSCQNRNNILDVTDLSLCWPILEDKDSSPSVNSNDDGNNNETVATHHNYNLRSKGVNKRFDTNRSVKQKNPKTKPVNKNPTIPVDYKDLDLAKIIAAQKDDAIFGPLYQYLDEGL